MPSTCLSARQELGNVMLLGGTLVARCRLLLLVAASSGIAAPRPLAARPRPLLPEFVLTRPPPSGQMPPERRWPTGLAPQLGPQAEFSMGSWGWRVDNTVAGNDPHDGSRDSAAKTHFTKAGLESPYVTAYADDELKVQWGLQKATLLICLILVAIPSSLWPPSPGPLLYYVWLLWSLLGPAVGYLFGFAGETVRGVGALLPKTGKKATQPGK